MSIDTLTPGGQKFVTDLVNGYTSDVWNKAIEACLDAMPSTAENPNEDSYQRGRFDAVMEYRRAIDRLRR